MTIVMTRTRWCGSSTLATGLTNGSRSTTKTKEGIRQLMAAITTPTPTTNTLHSQHRWVSDRVIRASHQTTTVSDDHSCSDYDRYRQHGSLSPYLLADLQLETLDTQRRISSHLLQEAQELVHEAWRKQKPPRAEPGPTGTWLYSFAQDETTRRRIYQRTWKTIDKGPKTKQMVLELDPTDEVLSLSLAVDESCIASLVENVNTGKRHVRLRHIETNRQTTLEVIGDGNLYESLVGLEWGPMVEGDFHSLYFVGTDKQGRPDRILASTVHSTLLHVDEPQLLIQSQDPAEIVDVQRTKGCQYVSIHVMTKTNNEIYLSSDPTSLELVLERQEHVQYSLDVGEQGDIVLLVSNHGSDYQLLESSVRSLPIDPQSIPVGQVDSKRQEKIVTDIDLFRDYLVLYETSTETGYRQITIKDRGSQETSHAMTLSLTLGKHNPCIQVTPAGNLCYGATSLRLLLETPVSPPATYEVDFASTSLVAINDGNDNDDDDDENDDDKNEDRDGNDWNSCKQERVFVSSADGTKIPISLFYKQGSKAEENSSFSLWNWFGAAKQSDTNTKESRSVVLIGYGAYGESVSLGYDPVLLPLLQKGYVLAFAHTRGGGELGKAWYNAGRREWKLKAIEDFEACAHYLKDRWNGKLIAKGFSAAGIIMGAAVNRQPQLFNTLVLTNPFLDLYSTMTNPSLFLTPHEWAEFGNPIQDTNIDKLLQSYCPITNISRCTDNYPRCLLIGTLDDENVPFWNSTIFAKKMRDRRKNKDFVSLHVEEQGGHHLRQHRLRVAALELAFILQDDFQSKV